MALPLASPFVGALPNPSRLVFGVPENNDEQEIWKVSMELQSSTGSGSVRYGRVMIVLRNGTCTLVSRQTVLPPNSTADDPTRYFIVSTREVATGYTDLMTAIFNAANNVNARRAAWEAHLRTAGHLDATLA